MLIMMNCQYTEPLIIKQMEEVSSNSLMDINDFDFPDFFDVHKFDQFQIQEENQELTGVLDYELINEYSVGNQFDSSDIDIDTILKSLSEDNKERVEDEDKGQNDSSDTTGSKKTKTDRSRTLISERRRRGRMKEKLYELRALVPNITKMDKASIVGDAVLYVQELQRQTKKLKTEIASLESSSLAGESLYNNTLDSGVSHISNEPVQKKIMQMDVFQMEEREFYLRLVCNKQAGVCVSLYKAIESLTNFVVQNSNLVTVSDRLVLTFSLNVRDSEKSINLPNLKLLMAGVLLNQGFELESLLSDSVLH